MKRDREALLRDRTEGEGDARRRRLSLDADVTTRRQERVAMANEALATTLHKNIKDWMKEKAFCVSDWILDEPELSPVGSYFSRPSPCPGPLFPRIALPHSDGIFALVSDTS